MRIQEGVEKSITLSSARLSYFERNAHLKTKGPTLLFVHATGFHARVWDKIINALGEHHSISLDQRGHGQSEKLKISHWDEVVSDTEEFIKELELKNLVAIGHSMGGHALIGAAASTPSKFKKIIAIDPVIPDPDSFQQQNSVLLEEIDNHPIAKRRDQFSSLEEMMERLKNKGSYGIFDPEIFEDYCRYGLIKNPDGPGYSLACPPEIEASVYSSSRTNAKIYESLKTLSFPVLIVRAKERDPSKETMDFSSSPTWKNLVNEFQNAREIYFPKNTHFLPMEIPEKITEIINTEISEL
ncbi:MAG: alpha/beta hydrolase [Gammaproteobacteria bacterium]|nr:alpha/beta hydrolase [Gammaproteobacteria bacterium]